MHIVIRKSNGIRAPNAEPTFEKTKANNLLAKFQYLSQSVGLC
jgi:hypothetical protein